MAAAVNPAAMVLSAGRCNATAHRDPTMDSSLVKVRASSMRHKERTDIEKTKKLNNIPINHMRINLLPFAMLLGLPMMTTSEIFAAEPQMGSGETNGYKLVWQDLFDGGELNEFRWNIEVNNSGGGNNELQYYTDRKENVHVGDDGNGNGCLILTARRENYINRDFTSGRITSKNFVTFTHGKIEASIKMPQTNGGLWPAFWMMGNDYDMVGWPKCGEIDIVEMGHSDGMRAGTSDRFFNGACHWGQGWPNASYAQNATWNYSLQDGEFHLFTCIWTDSRIEMYVDYDKYPERKPYYAMDFPANEPANEWSPGNYFHKPNFILFNLAIGGNFPGIHSSAAITALNEANNQEASMYVNYVKVYQREDEAGKTLFSAVESDPLDAHMSGVQMADAETQNVATEVFDLGGVRVAYVPAGEEFDSSSLAPGFYVVKKGNETRKIVNK